MSDYALVDIHTMYIAAAMESLLRPRRLAMALCRAALSALLRGAEELACRVMLRGMVADGAGAGATSAAPAPLEFSGTAKASAYITFCQEQQRKPS